MTAAWVDVVTVALWPAGVLLAIGVDRIQLRVKALEVRMRLAEDQRRRDMAAGLRDGIVLEPGESVGFTISGGSRGPVRGRAFGFGGTERHVGGAFVPRAGDIEPTYGPLDEPPP